MTIRDNINRYFIFIKMIVRKRKPKVKKTFGSYVQSHICVIVFFPDYIFINKAPTYNIILSRFNARGICIK